MRGSLRSFLLPFVVAVLALMPPFCASRVCATTISPIEGLELVRKGFSGMTDFTAEITQEKQMALLKKTIKSTGVVRFKRPDLFYMELYPPYPSRLLLKDNILTMTLPADGIKQKTVLPQGEGLLNWFRLLDRPLTKLPDGVEVRAEKRDGLLNLSIIPKEKKGVREISLALLADGRPRKLVIEEQNLDRTVINFRRVQKNLGLTMDDFRIE